MAMRLLGYDVAVAAEIGEGLPKCYASNRALAQTLQGTLGNAPIARMQ